VPFWSAVSTSSVRLRVWAQHHGGELLWAVIFALVVGIPAAVYFAYYITEPTPFKVYIVAGSHYLNKSTDPNVDTAGQFMSSFPKKRLADFVDVNLEIVELPDDDPKTAVIKAQELIAKDDALLVIGHLDSEPTEASLPVYLKARPQVPFIASVQTDDGLLQKACASGPNEPLKDSICYDGLKPLPYMQLSPTNLEQARWAIRFAIENHAHRFLILENDSINKSYSSSLASDYSKAIAEQNRAIGEEHNANHTPLSKEDVLTQSLIPIQTLSDEIFWEQLKDDEVDCLLYAGGFDGTDSLLKKIVELKKDRFERSHLDKNPEEARIASKSLLVILDDSVVEQRLNGAEFELSPIHITDQADAADYNSGISVYGIDALVIASQLIDDLNRRGFDWRFRIKKLLHRLTVEDARRNLVRVMQQNFDYHSSYFGATRTATVPESRTVYVFDGYTRANGMFHVWQRVKSDSGYKNIDVDRWHPSRNIREDMVSNSKKSDSKVGFETSHPPARP
jgi:hypothetical protein